MFKVQRLGWLLFSMSWTFTGCSLSGIDLGGGGVLSNAARPNGVLLAQGSLSSQVTGQAVAGNAIIFASGTSFILRFEGLTVPVENGLQAQVFGTASGNSPVFSTPLINYTGNQNFSFAAPPGTRFSNVNIFSVLSQRAYGSALLIYSNP